LHDLWNSREVVYFLVWRDLKVRYRQTYLGVAWAILQPLAAMLVFSIFLGKLAGMPSDSVPYPLFVLAGLIIWNVFSRTITGMTSSLVSNQELIRKIYFARLAIPVSFLVSSLVDFIPALALFIVMLVVFGLAPPPQILALPAVLLLAFFSSIGLGLFLASANVKYRDIGYVVPFCLQLLLFSSPIVYPASLIPPAWQSIYAMNPVVGIMEAGRWILLDIVPLWTAMAFSLMGGLILFISGIVYFYRSEKTFPDVI
jgi:lipopolysaccharide transport system permease protein